MDYRYESLLHLLCFPIYIARRGWFFDKRSQKYSIGAEGVRIEKIDINVNFYVSCPFYRKNVAMVALIGGGESCEPHHLTSIKKTANNPNAARCLGVHSPHSRFN